MKEVYVLTKALRRTMCSAAEPAWFDALRAKAPSAVPALRNRNNVTNVTNTEMSHG